MFLHIYTVQIMPFSSPENSSPSLTFLCPRLPHFRGSFPFPSPPPPHFHQHRPFCSDRSLSVGWLFGVGIGAIRSTLPGLSETDAQSALFPPIPIPIWACLSRDSNVITQAIINKNIPMPISTGPTYCIDLSRKRNQPSGVDSESTMALGFCELKVPEED
jgi:hypothetical protein